MDEPLMSRSIRDRGDASHRVIARRAQRQQLRIQQPVLDRKNRGRRTGRDADLVVDVLDVMPDGLGRDAERRGHFAIRATLCHEAKDLDLAIGQIARARRHRAPWTRAGAGQHRLHGLWIKPAGRHFLPQLTGRVVERPRGTMWPRLQHGLARIGRREHAGPTIEVVPSTAAVIAGAVETLVMRRSDRGDRVKALAAGQNAFGVVHVQAHTLPLVDGKRTFPLPDGIRHPTPANVVQQTRSPHTGRISGRKAEIARGRFSELRDAARVAECERRLGIGEVGEGRERLVDSSRRNPLRATGFATQYFAPHVSSLDVGHDAGTVLEERVDDMRIKRTIAAPLERVARLLEAARPREDLDISGNDGEPNRRRHLFSRPSIRKAAPVPTFEGMTQRIADRGAQPKPSGKHRRDLAVHGGDLRADAIRRFERLPYARRNVAARTDRRHELHEVGRHFVGCVVADGDHQLTKSHVFASGEVHQLMRIRRAANEAEQRRVVRVRELALGKTQRATKADGDQTRAQCMRHRLAQPEVRGNREGSNQLRESQAIGRIRCHEAILRLSLCFVGRSPDARRANGFRYCDHGGHAMFSTMSIVTQETLSRVTRYALAVLLLTSVHHAYGAFAYHTPWRLDAVFLSAFAAAAIISSLVVIQRNADETVREIAFWVFTAVVLVVPVALIGLFEGAYNHALKNALYFAGASSTLMNRLFPPPTYELPNDVFFEATGVMQAVLGSITAWLLYRLVWSRFGRIVVAPKEYRRTNAFRHVAE